MISPARRRIVYQAIKAAILKGTDVEYWTLTMYRQLDAGVLTDEQVAELEVLIDEYYNPPTPEPEPEPEPSTESQKAAEGVDEGETGEAPTEGVDEAEESAEEPESDLSGMSKAELLEYARERGVEVFDSWNKTEIVEAIQAAG